jgi:hypothetical protein
MKSGQFEYKIGYSINPKWFVGYAIEHDEMFLYAIDTDQVVSIFTKGGLDAMCFYEFINFNKAELLGEL